MAKGAVDEDDDITASVSVSGTRGFMAPEVRDRSPLCMCHTYRNTNGGLSDTRVFHIGSW